MSRSTEKFCARACSKEPVRDHVLFRKKDEAECDYLDRLTVYWLNRFQHLGFAYLLPHHFLDMFPLVRYYQSFRHYPLSLKDALKEFQNGSSDGIMVWNDRPISELFPVAAELNFDWAKPYNEDVFGPNLYHLAEHVLADMALYMGLIMTDDDIVIGCNNLYDPVCFMAGIFGSGTHCLAAAVENYHHSTIGTESNDPKYMRWLVETIHDQKLASSTVRVRNGEPVINSTIRLTHVAAVNDVGVALSESVRSKQEKEKDREMRERFGLSGTEIE